MWTIWGQIKHWLRRRNWERIDKIFCSKYTNIKTRCSCPEKNYKNNWYKWIKCEWETLQDFKNDMYESFLDHVNKYWIKNTQIDRIDPSKNYCKDNCRRATIMEQAYNKNNTLHINIDWVEYTSETFAKKFWISTELASSRISKFLRWKASLDWICTYWKMTPEKRTKIHTKNYIDIDWKRYSYGDIANIAWVTKECIWLRCKMYKQWKITSEDLFKGPHWGQQKHSIFCIVDWIEYNKDTLAQAVWCSPSAAWARIKKFNDWKIDKHKLFKNTIKK